MLAVAKLQRHVRAFGLARSDGTLIECSPESSTELFSAIIGGLGLTGLILWAEFSLMPSAKVSLT